MKIRGPHRPVKQRLRRGIYFLPSLFTIGNLLFGFYAIVLGFRGHLESAAGLFESAVMMIVFAAVLDTLDGRIARHTGTESAFGKEFDSLADVVTFGTAPALLAFLWGLADYGRAGWLIPLFFLLCAAIRLARFNVQTKKVDSRYFVGLPSPAAAGVIGALIFASPEPSTWESWIDPPVVEGLMILALIAAGSLMLSTFRYPSFKKIDRRRWSYRATLTFAAVILVLAYRPLAFVLSAIMLYALSGPLGWLWGRLRRREGRPAPELESAKTVEGTKPV